MAILLLGRLGKLKAYKDLFQNRTLDFPACSIVPQQTLQMAVIPTTVVLEHSNCETLSISHRFGKIADTTFFLTLKMKLLVTTYQPAYKGPQSHIFDCGHLNLHV
jgi:hypothetical protein